jgi:transcriptional regulator with XRE-family HTH domain
MGLMSSISHLRVIECRAALEMSQQQLADLLGVTKRTIQRWEDRGAIITHATAQTLANAVREGRPDLADAVLAEWRSTSESLGLPVPPDPQVVAAIVQAAADAGGTTPDAARPLVLAAFERAEAEGLDVEAVLSVMRAGG